MNKGLLIILIGIYGVALGFFTKTALTTYHTSWDLWRSVIFLEKMTFYSTFILFIFFKFPGFLSYLMLFLIPLIICFSSLIIYIILTFTIRVTPSGLLHLLSISIVNFIATSISIAVYWNSPRPANE